MVIASSLVIGRSVLKIQFLAQDSFNYGKLCSAQTGVKGGGRRTSEILF